MRLADVRTADGRVRYVVVNGRGEIVEPVARYLKHLDQRGYARNTLRSYGQGLGYYFAYFEERRVDYGAAGVEHRAGFVHWLKCRRLLQSQPPLARALVPVLTVHPGCLACERTGRSTSTWARSRAFTTTSGAPGSLRRTSTSGSAAPRAAASAPTRDSSIT